MLSYTRIRHFTNPPPRNPYLGHTLRHDVIPMMLPEQERTLQKAVTPEEKTPGLGATRGLIWIAMVTD